MKNNLFSWATSELSQDAFFCWLLSFAVEKHSREEPLLTECAKDLLVLFDVTSVMIKEIKRQYQHIDILVCLENGEYVIIEDKTYTAQHGEQLKRYAENLSVDGCKISSDKIKTVYLKIVEQAWTENDAINVTRDDLLKIFEKYIDNVGNQIFIDYYRHLRSIERGVKAYQNLENDISKWDNLSYIGFFTHLQKDKIVDDGWWGYVPNPTGGFSCLNFYWLGEKELEPSGLFQAGASELYLQIEDNIIAVKLTCSDKTDSYNIRWNIFEYFVERLRSNNYSVKKKTFRPGTWMTVCYVEYNFDDYKDKINAMISIMVEIENGIYKYQ